MNSKVSALLEQIDDLEDRLEDEFEKHRTELGFVNKNGGIVFDEKILLEHLGLKTGLLEYVLNLRLMVVLTAPAIYGMIIPFVLIDLTVVIYQAVCFPVYGLEPVRRSDFLVFDRRHLVYLNALEKFNCLYCTYANGVIGFIREVAARTEKYWCPIKHARRLHYVHSQYRHFEDYGDGDAYKRWIDSFKEKPSRTPRS